jgi:hypothetical protein
MLWLGLFEILLASSQNPVVKSGCKVRLACQLPLGPLALSVSVRCHRKDLEVPGLGDGVLPILARSPDAC